MLPRQLPRVRSVYEGANVTVFSNIFFKPCKGTLVNLNHKRMITICTNFQSSTTTPLWTSNERKCTTRENAEIIHLKGIHFLVLAVGLPQVHILDSKVLHYLQEHLQEREGQSRPAKSTRVSKKHDCHPNRLNIKTAYEEQSEGMGGDWLPTAADIGGTLHLLDNGSASPAMVSSDRLSSRSALDAPASINCNST